MQTITHLLTQELEELFASERYFLDVAPRIHHHTTSSCLRDVLVLQDAQKRVHLMRLQCAFDCLFHSPQNAFCKALSLLLEDAIERAQSIDDSIVREVYLMGAIQKSECITMVGYSLARDYALHLGHQDVAEMIQDTLAEKQTAESQLELMVKPPAYRLTVTRHSAGAP